jgi:hypothetical protein
MNRMFQNRRTAILWVSFAVIFVLLALSNIRLRIQHQKLLSASGEVVSTRQKLGRASGGTVIQQRQRAEEFARAWQAHPFAKFQQNAPAMTATDAYFQLIDTMHRLEHEAAAHGVIFDGEVRLGFSDFIHRGMAWDAEKVQEQLERVRILLTTLFRASDGDLRFIGLQRAGDPRELARFSNDLFDPRKFTPLFVFPTDETHLFRVQFICSTETFRKIINRIRVMPVVLQGIEAESAVQNGPSGRQSQTKFTLYLDWIDCAAGLTAGLH